MQRVLVVVSSRHRFLFSLVQHRWLHLVVAGVSLWWVLGSLNGLLTDAQWYESLGYGPLWRRRMALQSGLFILTAGVALALPALSMQLVLRNSGPRLRLSPRYARFEQWLQTFDRYVVRAAWVVFIIMALIEARFMSLHWREFVLFLHGGTYGKTDPYFGRDIGFYVFHLAGWRLLLDTAWVITLVTLLVTGMVTAGRVAAQLLTRNPRLPGVITRWFGVLIILWFLLRATGYYLSQFEMASRSRFDSNIATGLTYVDWHVRCRVFHLGVVLSLIAVFMLIITLNMQTLKLASGHLLRRVFNPWSVGFVSLVAVVLPPVLAIGFPGLVQHLIVAPDELQQELPFIAAHIQSTRTAWNLDQIEVQRRTAVGEPLFKSRCIAASNRNGQQVKTMAPVSVHDVDFVRIWDVPRLLQAARATEPPKTQYQFSTLHLDRYKVGPQTHLVGIAAREIDSGLVPKTWSSQHLTDRYIHGNGVFVASATAAQDNGLPRVWIEEAKVTESNFGPGVNLDEPRIFYGAVAQPHALVPDKKNGGVGLSSFWQRLIWSWRISDINLLLRRDYQASGAGTHLLTRRTITERAAALAPFLVPGDEPYPVIYRGHIVWMLDLLTATDQYPGANFVAVGNQPQDSYSAVSDSVKMVMDAVDGSCAFYVASPNAETDPILQSWQRAFPKLVRSFEQMPLELRQHRRYPRALFAAQVHLWERYHTLSPEEFFQQKELWQAAESMMPKAGALPGFKLDYLLLPALRTFAPDSAVRDRKPLATGFALQAGFTSVTKSNQVALLRADCDELDYGRLSLMLIEKLTNSGRAYGEEIRSLDAAAMQLASHSAQTGGSDSLNVSGDIVPIAFPDAEARVHLLLFKSFYRALPSKVSAQNTAHEKQGGVLSDFTLWRTGVLDTARPTTAPGIGLNQQQAVEDLEHKMKDRQSLPSDRDLKSLRSSTVNDAQITTLTAQALRLHDQAQDAAKHGQWAQAQQFWRGERALLQQLATLMRHNNRPAVGRR